MCIRASLTHPSGSVKAVCADLCVCAHAHVCVRVSVCVWASSACVHAVTCLMTQCLLKDEVAHLLVQPGGHRHHLHTHRNTHTALLHVASWHAPYTSLSLSLCICLTIFLLFLFSLGFLFMCLPSALSEAFFYCVTHADSTVPRSHCAFAAAHRKGCCLCLSACHLMPRTKCLSSQVIRLHRQA